jgi:uncharacterized membrane protein
MPISCGYCGASMPDISEFCPHCGRPVREGNAFVPASGGTSSGKAAAPAPQTVAAAWPTARPGIPTDQDALALVQQPPVDWNDRISGALAYLTFIPALVFLFAGAYKKRKFIRFHAVQSLLFWGCALVFSVLGVVASMFGWLFLWLLVGTLIGMALFFTWLLLSVKALQGEWFGLPLLGSFAEQQAGR